MRLRRRKKLCPQRRRTRVMKRKAAAPRAKPRAAAVIPQTQTRTVVKTIPMPLTRSYCETRCWMTCPTNSISVGVRTDTIYKAALMCAGLTVLCLGSGVGRGLNRLRVRVVCRSAWVQVPCETSNKQPLLTYPPGFEAGPAPSRQPMAVLGASYYRSDLHDHVHL